MKVEIIREGKYSDYLGSFGNYLNISKRIVCFSDTHMGDGTILDDFNRRAFSWFLVNVIKENDLVIGCGDIVDIWESGYIAFRRHGTIIDCLTNDKNIDWVWITGNHDLQMARFDPVWATEEYRFGPCVFIHGHQADILNSKLGFIGHIATIVNGVIEKIFGKGLDDLDKKERFIKKLPSPAKMTNDKFDQIKQQYIDYMQKLIAIDGNTCIGLFGHSHKAGVWVGNRIKFEDEYVNSLIINCGDFVDSNTFVILDKDGFQLCKVVG